MLILDVEGKPPSSHGGTALLAGLLRPRLRVLSVALVLGGGVSLGRAALVAVSRGSVDGLGREGAAALLPGVVGALVLVLAQAAFRGMRATILRREGLRIESLVRDRLEATLLELDVAGAAPDRHLLLSRWSHDAGRIRGAVLAAVSGAHHPITLGLVVLLAMPQSWRLAAAALVALGLVVPVFLVLGRGTRQRARRTADALAEAEGNIRDLARGVRVVQVQDALCWARSRLHLRREAWRTHADALAAWQGAGPAFTEVLVAFVLAVVLAVGVLEVEAGRENWPGLAAFLVGLALLQEPARGLATMIGPVTEGLVAIDGVSGTITGPRRPPEPADVLPLPPGPPELDLQGVGLRRSWGLALHGLDLHVPAGGKGLITGPSGSGKTTLLDIVAGLLPASAGTVLIAGRPPGAWSRASLGARLVWVGQEPWVPRGSLQEAIEIGHPLASDAVHRALRAVGLDHLWELGGGGLLVGEGGRCLSAGEAQRVALARALARDADLWLLDEPTAHLDEEAEAQFWTLVAQVAVGKTLLIASHRPVPAALVDVRVHLPPRAAAS